MNFIELHHLGDKKLIAVSNISVLGYENGQTFIQLSGDHYFLWVDESYDEIKSKLQEAGFIWSV